MQRTSTPKTRSRYFQPRLSFTGSHPPTSVEKHEFPGTTSMAATAEKTAPNEKNTDKAVTRYLFSFGNCSRSRVPSVGIEPCKILDKAQLVLEYPYPYGAS